MFQFSSGGMYLATIHKDFASVSVVPGVGKRLLQLYHKVSFKFSDIAQNLKAQYLILI